MTPADLQHDELFTLAERQLEGTVAPTDLARLNALLTESPDNRQRYLAHLQLHGELHWQTTDARNRLSATPTAPAPTPPESYPIYRKGYEPKPGSSIFHFSFSNSHLFAIAAALLAACGLATYVAFFSADPSSPDDHPHPEIPVANLIENASGGTLTTPGGFISEGRDYPRGEYALDRGTAEFMLTNAVNVKLRGETRLWMRNDMNVALTRGSADFVVPRGAQGFAVHLPQGVRIVDLGTAFSVDLRDNGPVELDVTHGKVRVEFDPDDPSTHHIVDAGSKVTVMLADRSLLIRDHGEITIANASFESPVAVARSYLRSIDNWRKSSAHPDRTSGVFVNSGRYGHVLEDVDGEQMAFLNTAAGNMINQTLEERFTLGRSYRLTVALAGRSDRPGSPNNTLQLRLYRGDDPTKAVAARTIRRDETYDDRMTDFTLDLPTVAGEWADESIGIQFIARTSESEGDWTIDNVRLTWHAEASIEPTQDLDASRDAGETNPSDPKELSP